MKNKKFSVPFFATALFAMALASCNLGLGEDTSSPTSSGSNVPTTNTTTSSEPLDYNLLSISITKEADQLSYRVGDSPNYSGLEVTAYFDAHTPEIVPHSDLVFSGFSSDIAGEKRINVSYTFNDVTKSTSYSVMVYSQGNVTLDFYGFNDVHGNVIDTALGVGIAKTTTFIKSKTANQHSLLISSGDMWQGSMESNSTRGALMTKWMSYLDFTSMTLGNHEFDWGTTVIENNATEFDLPILGINVIDKLTGERASYAQPSTVVYRGGVKIGIIGAIGDCYSSISYSQVKDVQFVLDKQGSINQPLTELIKAESTRLREEGCDFIVYSFHGDSVRDDTYYNPELSTGHYVDLVFEGHKHKETYYQDEGNVWHFQSAADSSIAINHIEVNIDPSTDYYSVSFDENEDIYWMNSSEKYSLAEDSDIKALIESYNFDQYYQALGYNSVNRSGKEMRQLNADLYFDKGVEKWTNYADQIVLGGGYISIRGEGYLPQGDVSYARLYNLFPFDNDVMLIQTTGAILKDNFINNPNSNYFLKYSTYGNTLRNEQSLINNGDLYYLIVDSYTYDYICSWNGTIIKVDAYRDTGWYARDFLADYAKAGKFDSGADLDPVVITHAGTIDDPYTIAEAYTLSKNAGSTTTWGFVEGVIMNSNMYLDGNMIAGARLQDENLLDYQMEVYRLHKYDNDPGRGFTSINEFVVGLKTVIYGGFKLYSGKPQFGSVNMVVTLNDRPISGYSMDDPISVPNYNLLDLSENIVYVFGQLAHIEISDNQITSFMMSGENTIDFDWPYNYRTTKNFYNNEIEIYYDESIDLDELESGKTNIIAVVNAEFVRIVSSDAGQSGGGHAGTYEDPYNVADALIEAAKHTSAADAPLVYCVGTVSRQAVSVGGAGDLKNVYIKDPDTNNEIQIYYLKKYEGAPSSDNFTSVNDLVVGDIIMICGRPFAYNPSTLEFASGTFCVTINGVPTGPSA